MREEGGIEETTSSNFNSNSNTSEHEQRLAEYLNSFVTTNSDGDHHKESHKNSQQQQQQRQRQQQKSSFPRVKCCGSSKGLYCDVCQKLLVPRGEWPVAIQNGTLKLPFDLDVILNDRRRSSSGFHAIVLLGASQQQSQSQSQSREEHEEEGQKREKFDINGNDFCRKKRKCVTRLIDVKEGDEIPYYNRRNNNIDIRDKDKQDEVDDTAFLLFPSKHSIPISKVVSKIKKLVVLDCKWTKTSIIQKMPQLQHGSIRHVHLDEQFVPKESYFWRWHNAGSGMCSTLEAIYFAALEVYALTKRNDDFDSSERNDDNNSEISNDGDFDLLPLMWLFAIQRLATVRTAKREGKPDPFTKEGKEYQRALRRTIKGSEKHLRDIEKGKMLKEIHLIENENENKKQKSKESKS